MRIRYSDASPEAQAGERYLRALRSACVRRGDFVGALAYYGPERRLDAVIRWHRAGRGPLRDALAFAWRQSEPDDTDPFYLWLWREIGAGVRIEDGDPLPPGDPVTIWRGQGPDAVLGIAWTLYRATAEWFANRSGIGGKVLEGRVHRRAILGYLTNRAEAEVVVDPIGVLLV